VYDYIIWSYSKQGGRCNYTGTQYCYQIEVLVTMWIYIYVSTKNIMMLNTLWSLI
jgi:hypothetical protein